MSAIAHPPTPSWRKSIGVAVVTVLTGLFLALLSDHLLIDELVKRGLSKIYAPTLTLFYPQTGQKSVTVLTIDDLDLKDFGLNWPVPLDYYQRIVDRLLKHQPKAIFLDVLFLDDKPQKELDSLANAACRSTQAGVPFFLATFANESLSSSSEAFLFGKKVDGKPCVIPVQSNISPDALDQTQWSYPLVFESDQAKERREKDHLPLTCSGAPASVALTLYQRLFKSECPTDVGTPMALIWGAKAATTNVQTMVSRSGPGAPLTPVCRDQWHSWEVIPGARLAVEFFAQEKLQEVCPYNQVLPARTLKGYGFSPEELHEAVSGKVVMIGADLKAVGDNIFSPVHGRLPGIHVHAMALDNLISFEGQYKQGGELDLKELWHSKTNRFTVFSVILISGVMVFWTRFKNIKIEASKKSDNLKPLTARDADLFQGRFERQAENNRKVTRSQSGWVARLLFFVYFFGLWILHAPRGHWSDLQQCKVLLNVVGALIYILSGLLLLFLGYVVCRQGPLVIIEYVMFAVGVHFFHFGEALAERISQWWLALQADQPWLLWAHLGQASEKHSDH